MIEKSGNFSVSVLHKDTNAELIGRFGFRSGKDFDKMESLNVTFGETGVPIVRDASIACLEFKVVDQLDVGTHILFIGELVSAELIEKDLEPMTYAFYREVKKGLAPRNAPTYIDKEKLQEKTAVKEKSIYKCAACGHIYDSNEEEIAFEDLPGNWTCPVCGVEKEDFIKV
jgi:flavin reductase (DIM6/NTAB) family NADH-FMN oxidoreductase RutF